MLVAVEIASVAARSLIPSSRRNVVATAATSPSTTVLTAYA
jgi:hypothetical protein